MNRKSFLGGLLALVAAPKSIAFKITEAPLAKTVVEAEIVSKYVAGYIKVSKQLMAHLPWLQTTLPNILMRDFKKKESEEFANKIIESALHDRNI